MGEFIPSVCIDGHTWARSYTDHSPDRLHHWSTKFSASKKSRPMLLTVIREADQSYSGIAQQGGKTVNIGNFSGDNLFQCMSSVQAKVASSSDFE